MHDCTSAFNARVWSAPTKTKTIPTWTSPYTTLYKPRAFFNSSPLNSLLLPTYTLLPHFLYFNRSPLQRMAKCELCAVLIVSSFLACTVNCAPQVPCYFIFGDSLVDNGNNNDIASLARANYEPYGIDFAGGPTGRFSNGLTTVDVIGICDPKFYKSLK